MSPRVFISHATADRAFVEREIISLLQVHGIDVWYCRQHIETAKEWERAILKGLQSCDWFLIVLSQESAKSEWVKDELHWAFANRPQKLVPVMIQDCRLEDFHIRLPRIQYVDFRRVSEESRHCLLTTWRSNMARKACGVTLPVTRGHERPRTPSPGLESERQRAHSARSQIAKSCALPSSRDVTFARRPSKVLLKTTIIVCSLISGLTLLHGWLKEGDIWLLYTPFWFPMLIAAFAYLVLSLQGEGETKKQCRRPAEVEIERKGESDDHTRPVPRKLDTPAPENAAGVLKTVLFDNRRPLLLWISIAALAGFTVLLLSSDTEDDWAAGYMFLGNTLLLIMASVISYLGRVRPSRICRLAAFVQVSILVGMLFLSIGDAGITIPINFGIAWAFVQMMLLYVEQERKQLLPNESFQQKV